MFLFDRDRSIKSCGIKKKQSWLGKVMTKSSQQSLSDSGSSVCFACAGHVSTNSMNYENFVTEGFSRNAIVYRAVSLIAKSVASVKLEACESKNLSIMSQLNSFINKPNCRQNKANFFEAAISYLLLSGNSYIYMSEDPLEMQLLRPDRVTIVPNKNNTSVDHYVYSANGSKFKISDPTKVIHLKFFNPIDDWYGFSPIQAASGSIDQHNAIARHNISLLQTGGRPSGCLIHNSEDEGMLNDLQRAELRESMDKHYSGTENAGRILVLDGSFKWQDFGNYARDYDFHKGKEICAREIAQLFGVPPMLVGVAGDSTFANYKEARLHFWEDTVIPLAEYIVAEINCWLKDNLHIDSAIRLNLDTISALAKKRERLWNRISNCDVLTINEKRRYLGFSELSEQALALLKEERLSENKSKRLSTISK